MSKAINGSDDDTAEQPREQWDGMGWDGMAWDGMVEMKSAACYPTEFKLNILLKPS